MKVIVIEDEKLAAERLVDLILDYDPGIEVLGRFDSVSRQIWLFSISNCPMG